MKTYIISIIASFTSITLNGQSVIPYGLSLDSIEYYDGYYHSGPMIQSFYCYKPLTYDSINSPILFAMHGSGGNGTSAISDLDSIAERRSALIVAPNFPFSGLPTILREQSADMAILDTACCKSPTVFGCITVRPATFVITEIYKYILSRENRMGIPVYMIGFSAGGQFVNRYMLWRQLYPDSIPLKMAVSSSAYFYTFPTDTFLGVAMFWNCGIIPPPIPIPPYCINAENLYSFCNGHIIQYYNENYGVLIGTGDTQFLNDGGCNQTQGNNRYERALNFYNFADSNAVTRGTTLQWEYVEIAGVGHDQHTMYNNKANPNDSSTIAESLLFDTPYNPVASIAAIAQFSADTTIIPINGIVNFINNSINAISYYWDFGDGSTSTLPNPSHVYTAVDTFTVQLKAFDTSGCWNWSEKRNYIKVQNTTPINEYNTSDLIFKIYPNPVSDILLIEVFNKECKQLILTLFNLLGEEEKQISFSESTKFDVRNVAPGIYFYKVMDGQTIVGVGKVIKL